MADSNPNPLYSGTMSPQNWYAIHGVALFVIVSSMCGSSYIIYVTRKTMSNSRLHILQKFPMYISICDLIFGFFHGMDHISSIITGKVASGAFCKFLGMGTVYAMNIPSFWVSACSWSIYWMVVKNVKLDFGKYDYILLCSCYLVPLLIGFIPFAWDGYSDEGAWCGLPYGRDLLFFNSLFIFAALLWNAFFYSVTYIHLSKMADEKKKHRENVVEFAKQLPVFVAIFIIQWIPYAIYAIMFEVKTFIYDYNVFTVIVVNSGGFLNALAYGNLIIKSRNAQSKFQTRLVKVKTDHPESNNIDLQSPEGADDIVPHTAAHTKGPSNTQMLTELATQQPGAGARLKHVVSNPKISS